jgi:hypothetical protein
MNCIKLELAPPASALVQSLRSIGYDLQSAVADIIDNSIAAEASNISVDFFRSNSEETVLIISDDGRGMDSKELQIAMTLGSNNPLNKRQEDDLGRFGMGLKTASFSQCQKLTVITSKDGSIRGAKWDLGHITRTNKWELFWLSDDEIQTIQSKYDLSHVGTHVIWEECDNIHDLDLTSELVGQLIAEESKKLYTHISLVFHKFLERPFDSINITLNEIKVTPKDPFVVHKKHESISSTKAYTATHTLQNEYLSVNGYILTHPSKLTDTQLYNICPEGDYFNSQGFYIYRANRLIFWGDWFRMTKRTQQNKLVRVEVNIPNTLDTIWRLDIKKAKVELPKELRSYLKKSIEGLTNKSVKVFNGRPTYKNQKSSSIWTRKVDTNSRNIQYVLDKSHPFIKSFFDELDDDKLQQLRSLLKLIEVMLPTQMMSNDIASTYKIQPTLSSEEKGEIERIIKTLRGFGMSTEQIKDHISNNDASSQAINDYLLKYLG